VLIQGGENYKDCFESNLNCIGDFPAFLNWSFVEVQSLLYHVLSGIVVENHHTIAKKIGTFLPDGPSQDFQLGEIAAFVNFLPMFQKLYQP